MIIEWSKQMKKLLPVLLVLLLTSCVTGSSYMKDFGQDTSELPILAEGAITKSADSESNDIIIKGLDIWQNQNDSRQKKSETPVS